MAAAVADYHPLEVSGEKLKRGKGPIAVRLEPTEDILKELGQRRDGRLLVGFAAETGNLDANAEKKLREKNLDMIVANDVTAEGSGFDGDTNIVTIFDRRGTTRSLPLMSKDEVAEEVLDHLLTLKTLPIGQGSNI
jgi:phosphopantothenoylcysteine decarboxylase / phosphopantothenate---cysteine ligase